MTSPMTKLMYRRAVPVDRLEIRLGPRDLYEVIRRAVEGAIATDTEVGGGRVDERFSVRQNETVWYRCGSASQFRRQTVALIGVEHRKPLEEWDRIRLIAVALGALAFLVRYKAVGIDDRGAVLALADISAEPQRLAEGEPILGAETVFDYRLPKDQHVDP